MKKHATHFVSRDNRDNRDNHLTPHTSHLTPLLLFFFLLSPFFLLQTNAQTPIYQLPNSGFEVWGANEDYGGTNGSTGPCPIGFNSFHSGYCTTTILVGTCQGVTTRCEQSTEVRQGATGQYSLKLFSNSIIGVRANGNLTSGRIYMGSATANSASNYNYTDYTHNAPKHYKEFTGTPDSMRVWVKYWPGRNGTTNTTDKGRIRVYIHGTGECRDAPQYPTGKNEKDYYYGKAMSEFYKEDGKWRCYTVPFEYDGLNTTKNANDNYYVLVSMTTNGTPGGGADNPDQVWVDDLEFVYSAWLNDLKVNGTTIDNFNKFVLNYPGPVLTGAGPHAFPYQTGDIAYTKESPRATVVVSNVPGPDGGANKGYTSILVTANDGSTKEYKIHYATNYSTNNNITGLSYTLDGVTPILIPGVNPATLSYTVTLANPDENRIPNIKNEYVVLSDPTASVYAISQPFAVYNSQSNVTIVAENYSLRTYSVSFAKPVSSNKNLGWLKIDGIEVPNFHPDTLEYNHIVTACVTANSNFPTVTYETSSVWATASLVSATTSTKASTITVTAQNGDVKTYKVNFIYGNNNASLLGYRINGANQNNVFSDTNFTHTYFAAMTAVPAFALSTTAGQQVCGGSTVTFPTLVWYPDTNKIIVTAQDGVTNQKYNVIVQNTNCYLKVTSGNTAGLKYRYNGQIFTVPVVSGNNSNNNLVNYNLTLPIGPNVPAELIDADPQAPKVDKIIYNQPETRVGVGSATVYAAHSNGANKTYQVTFSATLSSDATLKYITYNGLSVPGFNPTTELYTLIFPSTATVVPEIDYAPTFEWLPAGNIVYTKAATLSDTTFIKVTSEKGDVIKTYKTAFELVPQEKDAYLIDIRYDGKTIAGFNPAIYDYTIEIPYSAPLPPAITAITSSPTALAFFSAQLTTPPYTQQVLVYSEDMTVTKLYKVNFVRVKNTNAALTNIKINGVSLQGFNPEIFDYEYELPYTEFNAPVVTTTPAFQHALVAIDQINSVSGTVTINVTAEDDAFSSVYTIDFTRELSPVNTIETIVYEYDNETYTIAFPVNETEVTLMLPMETLEVPVILDVVLVDNRATFEIDEQPAETNELTGSVIVTAEDSNDATYAIVFKRTPSSSTLLTGIYYNGNMVPNFNPALLNYSIILPFDYSQIPQITAIAAWQGTVVVTQNPGNPFGTGYVTVTSEDEATTLTYTIVFERKGSPYLAGLYYVLDGTTYQIPDFSSTIFEYDVLLPLCTSNAPELEYLPEDNRCNITVTQPATPNSTSSVTLVTWNEDDSKTYTVNFTVELSEDALLDSLLVNGVHVAGFNPNVYYYTIEQYPYGTELPVVTAKAKYCDATMDISDIEQFPGKATVKVTAGNNSTKTYSLSFSVHPGSNTYLWFLLIDDEYWLEFKKDKYFYEIKLPHGTTEFPKVEGIPEDETSTVTYTSETTGNGKLVTITVTSLDGNVSIYKVAFVVEGNNNAFAKMIYVDGKSVPNFDKYVRNYTYNLPDKYMGIPWVTAEKEDMNAKLHPVDNSAPFKSIVMITAEDGYTEMQYTITFVPYNSVNYYGNEAEIQVYPNPSSNFIYFKVSELGQTAHLEIFSMEGKRISKHTLQNEVNKIHIESLQKGIYFYKIFNENTMIGAGKFIKN